MKTREEYSVLLTAEELCTLAGMLGQSWLFAVDGKALRAWQSDVPHRVVCAAERMERRGLLDFELNGTLRLRPELRQLMERLSKPERVLVHTGTSAGKHETTYYLGSGERWAVVTRPETDCYRLALCAARETERRLCGRLPPPLDPVETALPLREARGIQERLASFQEDEARKRLLRAVGAPQTAQFVRGLLTRANRLLVLRLLVRRDGCYFPTENCLVSYNDTHAAELRLTEDDRLLLRTYSPDALRGALRRFLYGGTP